MKFEIELERYIAYEESPVTDPVRGEPLFRKVDKVTATVQRPPSETRFLQPEMEGGIAIGVGESTAEAVRAALKQVTFFEQPLAD
jgi:hypothetical protein